MNNFEKFYKISGMAIDIFLNAIKKQNDNFEHEKKKILHKIKDFSDKDRLELFMTWQFLIDYAMLCLNKEKIENDVNLNWDNYVPQNFISKSPRLINTKYSKIRYFNEWLRVIDCKEKYLAEDSRFWIKRIRNSFLHGNFEYDYSNMADPVIKIFEGTSNSTDIKMVISCLGLHEFIEDNFHNVVHDDFGISSSYIDLLLLMNDRITNRKQLEDLIKNKLFMLSRKVDSNFYYNGNDIINSSTGEKVGREKKFIKFHFEDNNPVLEDKAFLNPNADIFQFGPDFADDLIWILENKCNIYNCKKQKKEIFSAVKQYCFSLESINLLLHEFDSYCGAVTCDKRDYKNFNIDLSKTGAILYNYGDNIENAFTILKLCRMMYRYQNKNFEKINNSLYDSKSYMIVPTYAEEEMQKRIDKQKSKIIDESISEEDKNNIANNNAYLETLRNSLAHGNIDVKFSVFNNKLQPIFKFADDFTNKRGERQIVELRTSTKIFNDFLDVLEFVAEDKFDTTKILQSEVLDENEKE